MTPCVLRVLPLYALRAEGEPGLYSSTKKPGPLRGQTFIVAVPLVPCRFPRGVFLSTNGVLHLALGLVGGTRDTILVHVWSPN